MMFLESDEAAMIGLMAHPLLDNRLAVSGEVVVFPCSKKNIKILIKSSFSLQQTKY